MTQQEFIKKNTALIERLKSEGKEVVVTVQNVHGTAYEKTSHRILNAVSAGQRNIVVLTNAHNPVLDKLTNTVRGANLAMPAVSVTLLTA